MTTFLTQHQGSELGAHANRNYEYPITHTKVKTKSMTKNDPNQRDKLSPPLASGTDTRCCTGRTTPSTICPCLRGSCSIQPFESRKQVQDIRQRYDTL